VHGMQSGVGDDHQCSVGGPGACRNVRLYPSIVGVFVLLAGGRSGQVSVADNAATALVSRITVRTL